MPATAADRGGEDSDAIWFDADGDGRLDLLVLSGSSSSSNAIAGCGSLYLHRGMEEGGPVFERAGASAGSP